MSKISLTLFVFMFTLTLAALIRITNSVPPLSAQLAAYSCLVGLGVFLYLLDHVGKISGRAPAESAERRRTMWPPSDCQCLSSPGSVRLNASWPKAAEDFLP